MITIETIKLYAIILAITLVFIVFVLRAVYMLLNKRDPINAITMHPSEWKILKWDKDKVDKKVRSVMS
jgi:hypothetical protein